MQLGALTAEKGGIVDRDMRGSAHVGLAVRASFVFLYL